LALLRALASSPASAVATLRSRASVLDTETAEEADELGRRMVFDQMEDESIEGIDTTSGSDLGEEDEEAKKNRRKLQALANEADKLKGEKDAKLAVVTDKVKKLLKSGYRPIVFCRFIHTAEYVEKELQKALKKGVEVRSVTGTIPPADREARILELAESKSHVLVATDCLSEGINLQDHFDAVVHYDLSWNPTRHEQREGRVDRYGQSSPKVSVTTMYGVDNQIDGIVLEILIKKHQNIRNSLGISVPVPINSDKVIEAIFEGILLRKKPSADDQLVLGDQFMKPQKDKLHEMWDRAVQREASNLRTMFAQVPIKVEQVKEELESVRKSLGSSDVVEAFTTGALRLYGASIKNGGAYSFDLTETPKALREMLSFTDGAKFKARFSMPVEEDEEYLTRTHPIVESLATHVLDASLDEHVDSIARRCGVIRTNAVETRTTVLLLRLRYHIVKKDEEGEHPLLAEDSAVLGFTGSTADAKWLPEGEVEKLLEVTPDGNTDPSMAKNFLSKVIADLQSLEPHLNDYAEEQGKKLLDSHKRVRSASKIKNVSYRVEPKKPVDVLGVYVYLPIGS
jgi:hypothetical protein